MTVLTKVERLQNRLLQFHDKWMAVTAELLMNQEIEKLENFTAQQLNFLRFLVDSNRNVKAYFPCLSVVDYIRTCRKLEAHEGSNPAMIDFVNRIPDMILDACGYTYHRTKNEKLT